jgi:hypothetical protein
MRFFLAASVATTLLVGTGVTVSWAQKGKKGKDAPEMSSNIKQQFEWEEKVVGPKEGLDHKKMAAIQERGKREDEERKKEPPKKVVRNVAEPSTATLPTMDIEKPAAAPTKTKKAKVAEAPKQRDALDNLLDEQGVKPNKPPSGGDGLSALLASGDDRSSSQGKSGKKGKKSRPHRRN